MPLVDVPGAINALPSSVAMSALLERLTRKPLTVSPNQSATAPIIEVSTASPFVAAAEPETARTFAGPDDDLAQRQAYAAKLAARRLQEQR